MKHNIARWLLGHRSAEQNTICISGDTPMTRGELRDAVGSRAGELLAMDVAPGEFVVVTCGRGPEFFVDLLALWVIGARAVALEPNPAPEHAENVIALTGATRRCSGGESTTPELDVLDSIPLAGAVSQFSHVSALPWRDAPAGENEGLAGLIFTSGTTGLPKGVPLRHDQLIFNALATRDRLRLSPDDHLLIATPFRFISSISHFLVTVMSGATFSGIETTLMAKDLLGLLVEREVTAFGGSPFHVQFLAQAGAERLPLIRWVMSSGDHLAVEVIEALETSMPQAELHVVYGMAEMAGRICELPPRHLDTKKGSVGYPIDGIELRILDDDGEPCPVDEVGHVFVDGSYRFDGYFGMPANDELVSANGFRTGDKGRLDEDGFVWLSGRSDSVFKRSGLKVSAQIIIDALKTAPGIVDAFVRGEEDQTQGRVPVAWIVTDGPFDRAETLRYLRGELPTNHLPARFNEVENIPRTGSGKVNRRALDELA